METLLNRSAKELARMIRHREVSSREVVEAHIRRIEEVNPALNAVVATRFDDAREEARRADVLVARAGSPAEVPPLCGVPCTIKEAFALEGMPNTGGLLSRKGIVAGQDAPAVARLRAAGAIPLGVTNVSELSMWVESYNLVYGRTSSAHGRGRTSGGSSGGEGAIISAGGSPFGLGSDIGGSIRIPAFFNGVFGHKPSGGLVPNSGQFPLAAGRARRYLTSGPIARHGEDLWPLLEVLAGPDREDLGCYAMELGDPAEVRLEGLAVRSVPDDGHRPVNRELRRAQRRVEDWLEARGAEVRRAPIAGLRRALDVWAAQLEACPGPSYAELLGEGRAIHLGPELLRVATGRPSFTAPSLGLAAVEAVQKLFPASVLRAVDRGRQLRQEVSAAIGDGVMLYPPYPDLAPRHRSSLVPPFGWTYTAVMNALELPATLVPLGLSRRGLPLGIQVASTHGADHRTIAVAMELERAFGGWVRPESV